LTLSEYAARVKEYVPASLSLPSGAIYSAINAARKDVSRLYDFSVKNVSLSGDGATQLFTLNNVQRVYYVKNVTGDYFLKEGLLKDLRIGGEAGNPLYYWLSIGEQKIGFYPIPDDGVTIDVRYSEILPDLSGESSNETIPTLFMILYVIWRHLMFL